MPIAGIFTVFRRKPANLQARDNHLFSGEYQRTISVSPLRKHSKRYFFNDIIFNRYNLPCLHLSFPYTQPVLYILINTLHLLILRTFRQPLLVTSDIVCPVDNWTAGYFHWITEVLVRSLQINHATGCKSILCSSRFTDTLFMLDSLKHIGLEASIIQPNQYVYLNTAFTGYTVSLTGNYCDSHIKDLRQRIHSNLSLPSSIHQPSRRLWISRNHSCRRTLLNEHHLLPLLDRFYFEVVYLEDLSFVEQMHAAASSATIAGVHGAGLSCMVAMCPGTNVLELRSKSDVYNNCYFALASSLSLNYYYQKCNMMLDSYYCPEDQLYETLVQLHPPRSRYM